MLRRPTPSAPRGRRPSGRPGLERRDFLFDASWLDTSDHDLILVAGTRRYDLRPTSVGVRRSLRRRHPVLQSVPDERLTHWARGWFPDEGVQTCYVQRVRRSSRGGGTPDGLQWDLVHQFDHLPTSALVEAARLVVDRLGGDLPSVPSKWARFGLSADDLAALDDPVGLDLLKTADDTACAMLSKHPEVVTGDATTAAYVQQTAIAPNTGFLADYLEQEGPIEPQQDAAGNLAGCSTPYVQNATGYGTNVPVCDPDTKTQAVNSHGQLQYVPVYSTGTNELAGESLPQVLQTVKADPTLGVNTSTTPGQDTGVLYRYAGGTTTVEQSDGVAAEAAGLAYVTKHLTPGHGYSATVTDFDPIDGPDISADVTLEVHNWYVRYLGLYVRYLDANGDALSVTDLIANNGALLTRLQTNFPLQNDVGHLWNTDTDFFLDLLPPEKEILGIPTGEATFTATIPVPNQATSFELLAGGLGNSQATGKNLIPGATMTGVFNLALPTFFLGLNAAAGVGRMVESLSEADNLATYVPLVLDLFADSFEALGFSDPGAFLGLATDIAETLLSKGAESLVKFIVTFLAEGETQDDLLDAIPLIGGFLNALQMLGVAIEIAETSTQLMQSPSLYDDEVTLTHDVRVTIAGDPANAGSWPSTATEFTTVILIDGATSRTITQSLPSTTVDTQTVTFAGVPLGGKVTASVQVNAATGFQVATASVGPFDNVDPAPGQALSIDLTLKQAQVPLTANTVYTHKEVIALNAAGDHVWSPTTTPVVQELPGCEPTSGQLCALTDITVNTTAGQVGQTFQAANDAVTNCVTGAAGQTHLFSNASTTADPQAGYFFSGCGFSQAPIVVYDLVNDPDLNFYLDPSTTGPTFKGVLRQIRLSGSSPGFDPPNSDKAWGRLQFPSDTLLLHPGRQVISINTSANKIEVVQLPDAATPDAEAPLSHAYGGAGTREGLMKGPVLAALAPDGTVLVLESSNKRVQAFDLNANPAAEFGSSSFFPLRDVNVATYLDFAVEFKGYLYVLWEDTTGTVTLDLYEPDGTFLASTPGFSGRRIAVNYWRDVYAQNQQVLRLPDGSLPPRTEPSISHWIPSTP
ncbi:MAG TPA: hypothetical protein VJ978_13275 [Nitriliruptoraceae bacterium]|nr:hypothetical protein [Nitriliruptoraceae bacterium]